jgi:4-nitrophenyl phosphatase
LESDPRTYVFDLDGVIYRGNEPQPHASETLRELRLRGHKISFFTNNSTKSREDYKAKLDGMNIPVSLDEIMTSAYATALYLQEQGRTGSCVYVVGENGLVHELESTGMEILQNSHNGRADFVVVGLDKQFTYEKMMCAQQHILAGAKFIATNTDATFPVEEGVVIPGGGAIVSSIETASGIEPMVIGKPQTYALSKLLQIAGGTPERSIMIGDRLESICLLF